MSGYIGIDNKSKNISKIYIGDSTGHAKNISKAYVGVNGKSKQWYNNKKAYIEFVSSTDFSIAYSDDYGEYWDDDNRFWDGTLQYSKNLSYWYTLNESIVSHVSPAKGSDNKYHLYLRGSNNHTFSYNGHMVTSFPISLGADIDIKGDLESLLDYKSVENNIHPPVGEEAFYNAFATSDWDPSYKINVSELILTKNLSVGCYSGFFGQGTFNGLPQFRKYTTIPDDCFFYFTYYDNMHIIPYIPDFSNVTNVGKNGFHWMFYGNGNNRIKLSTSQSSTYPYAWTLQRLSNAGEDWSYRMFSNMSNLSSTGRTYYSNTPVQTPLDD